MKRVAVFTLVVVAFGFSGCRKSAPKAESTPSAETRPAPPPPTVAPAVAVAPPVDTDKLAHPLFWSIEKDGKTSYALGTIHVGVDATTKLPASVWAKLDAAPTFAMETDLSDPVIMTMLKCVQCSLKRDLGAKDYGKLEQLLGQSVVRQIEGMKPMVAATMLAMRGLPPSSQMDTSLHARAQEKGHRIVYLEPASHQAAMLEKHMNIKALKMMIDDPEDTLESTQKLLAAYIEGDEAKMVALSAELKQQSLQHGYTEQEYEESQEDMLYKRNESWIAPIEKLHAEGGGFIAVGALHLVGPRNVLELLGKKGYKITRM